MGAETRALSGADAVPAQRKRFLTVDNRYLPPLLITCILLAAHLSFGILEGWERTGLAIVTAIGAELVMGRITYGTWPHPASAYISGISAGILIRSPFLWPYFLTSFISILSKYVLRLKGRHIWNPTNFGVSAVVLLAPYMTEETSDGLLAAARVIDAEQARDPGRAADHRADRGRRSACRRGPPPERCAADAADRRRHGRPAGGPHPAAGGRPRPHPLHRHEGHRMNVQVNGVARHLADGATVADLVGEVADDPRGVAVAVDGEVVPRLDWPTTPLHDGQAVEILTAVQGG